MGRIATASGGKWVGIVLMVFAAFFYGAMNISVKLGANHLTLWQTAIGRFALGAALVPILTWKLRLDLFGQQRWLLVIRGVSGAGAFLLIVQALKTIPLSVGMVLFYLWPVFSCLLSSWIAGEPTTKKEWPFVCGAVIGTVLILWPGREAAELDVGHFFALGASFLAGLAIILVRRLVRTNNPFTMYFYFCITGGLLCIRPLLAQGPPLLPASRVGWFGLIAVAIFAMAGQVLMNQGMKYLNAPKTGVLMMLEVLAAVAFGVVYLSEPLTVRLLCGSGLILGCGVVLIVLPMRSNHPPEAGSRATGEKASGSTLSR